MAICLYAFCYSLDVIDEEKDIKKKVAYLITLIIILSIMIYLNK